MPREAAGSHVSMQFSVVFLLSILECWLELDVAGRTICNVFRASNL